MISKIFIANRGEIALRIIRAAREMNIATVVGYAKVDAKQSYLQYADEAVCIGERSYLCPENIVMAAKLSGCDSVHPGYGFLSENPDFAAMVESAELIFIGPSSEHIKALGDKAAARVTMEELGMPAVPGALIDRSDIQQSHKIAAEVGYPIVIKAVFGGGGKGIRKVESEAQLADAISIASAEAELSFAKPDLYLEKYLDHARHIEVQLLGDGKGKVVHLGTRDCSIQRSHQKLIEEAPASYISALLRTEISELASAALAKLKYRNAATVELLVQDEQYYFLEVNTRLQVEHTVTEEITGIDLVQQQINIASGEALIEQDQISLGGYAIECRICAEDEHFIPSPGRITELQLPGGPGVRLDTHIRGGDIVPHQYDAMIAKLICTGRDRDQALARMRRALSEFKIKGIKTNVSLLLQICSEQRFKSGDFNTRYLDARYLKK